MILVGLHAMSGYMPCRATCHEWAYMPCRGTCRTGLHDGSPTCRYGYMSMCGPTCHVGLHAM